MLSAYVFTISIFYFRINPFIIICCHHLSVFNIFIFMVSLVMTGVGGCTFSDLRHSHKEKKNDWKFFIDF
jgi:hypothetical protein